MAMRRATAALPILLLLTLADAAKAKVAACPILEVTATVADHSPGAHRIAGGGAERLNVLRQPIVSRREVTGARASVEGGENAVLIDFTPEAAGRLEAYTAGHIGDRMVVVLNGRALRSMRIDIPMGGHGIQFTGMNRRQAERLAADLTRCAAR